MKLEYIANIYKDYPEEDMIRLYDFDNVEAAQLQAVIQEKLLRNREPVRLESLGFVEALNCQLKLVLADEDKGIVRINDSSFECRMTEKSYFEMVGLMQTFADNSGGYQWLYDLTADITPTEFLFSASPKGTW